MRVACSISSGLAKLCPASASRRKRRHQPSCRLRKPGPGGNEDLLKPGMLSQPSAGLGAVMAGEIVGDTEDVARCVVGFDVRKQGDVVGRVARGGTPGQFLAITHAQRSIHPGFLRTATVIYERFDAMPIGRPAGGWGEGTWHYWPQFVGADGRRPVGRRGVVADDRCSFGTKSASELSPQLCV
jgi:hypothetical protein